jgi:predicted transcriptional regulator
MSTITVPDELESEMDAFARERGIAPTDLVRDAIEEYIYFRRMRDLRARMADEAQAHGRVTDEDVFDRIS